MDITVKALYEAPYATLAKEMLEGCTYPWEALGKIHDTVLEIGATLSLDEYDHPEEDVWIAKDAKVYPTATITGPCIIGKGTEVRPGAFIRGNVLVGDGAVVGNSTELKNVILFDKVQVPHYNYVGDSILGYKAHLGAQALTSNVRSDKQLVVIKNEDELIETGCKKVGAFLGSRVEVGCSTVLNPGTIIGHDTNVYPESSVRGVVPPESIYKSKFSVEIVTKK